MTCNHAVLADRLGLDQFAVGEHDALDFAVSSPANFGLPAGGPVCWGGVCWGGLWGGVCWGGDGLVAAVIGPAARRGGRTSGDVRGDGEGVAGGGASPVTVALVYVVQPESVPSRQMR